MSEPLDLQAGAPRAAVHVPAAESVPVRRRSATWWLPLLALVFALYTGWRAWSERGPLISVEVRDGHGIQVGDALRYRGIQVGEIEGLSLSDDLARVQLRVRLLPAAASMAREGTLFWLVRPELSLEGVRGLETVLGANYLAVRPAPREAPDAREFVALERPPIGEEIERDGLYLLLEAPTRFGLAPGAAVTYREFQVGAVTDVQLASDATSVEVQVYIRPGYRQLVREDSRFYETGGVEIDLALTQGLHVDIGTLRSLLVGGIALTTPTRPGASVESGHRFTLHAQPDEDWLEWRPSLPVGDVGAPTAAELPRPLAASIRYRPDRLLGREKRRAGWMTAIGASAIGPRDLVDPGEDVKGETAIEIDGRAVEAGDLAIEGFAGLVRVPLAPGTAAAFPAARVALDARAGEWLLVGPAEEPPLAVGAARLVEEDGGWRVLDGGAFGARWHGAAVVEREQGLLVGILLADEDGARVEPIPAAWLAPD